MLDNHTIPQLHKELKRCLDLSHESLIEAAKIWVVLRERKADLSSYPSGLHKILPLIASGKLAPETVLAFAGEQAKVQILASLPIVDQKTFAAGASVQVVRGETIESRPVSALSSVETARVFKDGKINSVDAQRKQIVKAPARFKTKTAPTHSIERAPSKQAEISWRHRFRALMRTATVADREWARKELKVKQ